MTEQQIDSFLTEQDFTKIPSSLPEFTIHYRIENNYVNVLHVIDFQHNLYITEDQYIHLKEKIKALFAEMGIREIHILSLAICRDMQKVKQLCKEDIFCWMIDPDKDQLIIYENQAGDFYGMKEKLEDFLANIHSDRYIPYVTVILVALNIIVFIICTFTGDLLYNKGAFDAAHFIDGKEYLRILTSIFLHGNIEHLASNMIVLYFLGEVAEEHFRRFRYTIIYFAAGISGNLLSLAFELYSGSQISTVGASGAIFGVIGSLLILVIINKGHLNHITIGRLIFMIFYSLYSGFAGSNINNAAHIGGFISGIAVSSILLWMTVKMKKRLYRNGGSYEN